MANPEHVAVVRRGAEAIAEWRRSNPGVELDLVRADLAGAELPGADLAGADLGGANLWAADLSGASLSGARLVVANLTLVNLTKADLSEASLYVATLKNTNLRGVNFSQARLADTSLGGVDLSQCAGLATVQHIGPSSVGVDTLIASFRSAGNKLTPELKTFFRGAGVPQELLDALPAIVAEVKYHSCFISYGHPNLQFAAKLRDDLVARGVSCWLYEMDKTVGEPTWQEIERKLEEYDRMVVVCSIDALMRDGVKKEIDKQIDKGADKLVPVSLDSRWTHPGFAVEWAGRDLKRFLTERNRADFSTWDSDPERYEKALEDLLKGLRRQGG